MSMTALSEGLEEDRDDVTDLLIQLAETGASAVGSDEYKFVDAMDARTRKTSEAKSFGHSFKETNSVRHAVVIVVWLLLKEMCALI